MGQKSAVILFSAGLDSTVNLYQALTELNIKLALTMNYGQKAFEKEQEKSSFICRELGVKHQVLELPWLSEIASSSLVSEKQAIPTKEKVDIFSQQVSESSAKSVWVSNRNGLFINIAASFAEELEADFIVVGFNKEEAATFPDNSVDFIKASNLSLSYSTQNQVQVMSYTQDLNKKEIFSLGKKLDVNFENIWPCYFSEETLCRECESCKRYLQASK